MPLIRKNDQHYELDWGNMSFSFKINDGVLKCVGSSSSEILDDQDADDYWNQAEEEANSLFREGAITDETIDELYSHKGNLVVIVPTLTDVNEELKGYLSKHPELLYHLTPRTFELLIADILKDLGFDVEVTGATRDGGVDIYAYLRHEVAKFLMFVECKKWASTDHVGIEAVQRLYGIQQNRKANKSMIVTTSFFSKPAIQEARKYESLMSLKDYNDLKKWLIRYR